MLETKATPTDINKHTHAHTHTHMKQQQRTRQQTRKQTNKKKNKKTSEQTNERTHARTNTSQYGAARRQETHIALTLWYWICVFNVIVLLLFVQVSWRGMTLSHVIWNDTTQYRVLFRVVTLRYGACGNLDRVGWTFFLLGQTCVQGHMSKSWHFRFFNFGRGGAVLGAFVFGMTRCLFRQTDKETNNQTDRQPHKQTNRQTYIQTDRQTTRQTDKPTNRQTDKQTNWKAT